MQFLSADRYVKQKVTVKVPRPESASLYSVDRTPQVVQTLKSLSSVALLAVSQLCTMRLKLSGRSSLP
jgi:hypothetical protein